MNIMNIQKSEIVKAGFAAVTVLSIAATGGIVSVYADHGGSVHPDMVEATLPPGGELEVPKEVTTPSIPAVVDVCLLEDETGSFLDDIANLQGGTTASDIYDAIVAASPGAQFAVAGFRDYDLAPFGSLGDWVYRLLSSMSPAKAAWLAGIAGLTAGGGNDLPESQYDAIVAAAGPGPTDYEPDSLGPQDDCGWRDPAVTPGVQRVLVVTTDAPFHLPGVGKPHANDSVSTIAALNVRNIKVIGLKAPGAGGELDALAVATGGSVQPLSSDGSDIADAIIAGLEAVTTDVWWEADCDAGLSVTLDPLVHENVAGGTPVNFTETITVSDEEGGEFRHCTVTFIANEYPAEGSPIGEERIWITVIPPEVDKDYRQTDVCFERDNDLDGAFNEDPTEPQVDNDGDGSFDEDPVDGVDDDGDGVVDEDPSEQVDNDGDGSLNEDDVDCSGGTSLGTPLPQDVPRNYILDAVVNKKGKVTSYNPGQYYAVTTVELPGDLSNLSIWEEYGDCTDPEGGTPISALNPASGKGGGNVVIVEVGPDGVAKQIADSNSPNVEISDEIPGPVGNGIPDDAHADLVDLSGDSTYYMYVKFAPGLKGLTFPNPDPVCHNDVKVMVGDGLESDAGADLKVVPKGD